ncbi:protein phosphatase 1 regulatory subunit 37-like [Anthonomus grandis grandis]|uniref:protein phosphatase 1 regulatory subunit 37-like n=1 Tax=Anthonomus grandis grandis TaxID=2921223 RepID=UPI0021668EB5|nr:protein phosphatase 1 regulatory subunit 37-like [Anthonomus grandis grandis]
MDLASCVEENETPFLIDSGTESITESPLDTEQSENSTLCNVKINCLKGKGKLTLATSLIDKSFSVEEDELCTPLEPTQVGIFHLTPSASPNSTSTEETSDEDDGIEDIIHIDVDNNRLQKLSVPSDLDDIHLETSCVEDEKLIDYDDSAEIIPVDQTNITSSSILRKTSCLDSSLSDDQSETRHVCFPAAENELVSYKEPENQYPWTINEFIAPNDILQIYQQSCMKHNTIELDAIKSQILEIKNNLNHSATLKLSGIKISREVNETLEDILKVTNFHSLALQECQFTSETMTEFLNMLEYYKSVCHFEIAMNFDDDETWKCFCNACSNIMVLESLSFKGMVLSEPYMRHLMSAIKNNPNITTLKFDGCMLVKLPTFYLVDSLMTNRTICELYLPSTGLYTKEADALQRFLVNNRHLKVLDISNNNLGDRGLEVLAKGLCQQTIIGSGLSVLVIFNNQITEKSGPVIKNIIVECKNLHTLNIGYNNLTDKVLYYISDGLPYTQSLEGLGLQCTLLTCKGILALSKAIPSNFSLQKINLKGNKAIQLQGIEKLCTALTANQRIIKVEIDDHNRSCNDPEAYSQLVKKLSAICTINKNYMEASSSSSSDEDDEILKISQKISRKVSLNCEPKFAVPDPTRTFQIGSPIPSPASSPAPRSRFQIVKVAENGLKVMETPSPSSSSCSSSSGSSGIGGSRFKVTRVPPLSPSLDDDINLPGNRFSNIRSSVSSNDSVDSLATIHLETDDEVSDQ